MGVYIKDMAIPTRCGRCDMCIKEVDGDIDYHYECCITAAVIKNLGEKMVDCPLVHVPPHGDLIDRDALYKEFERNGWSNNADRDIAEDALLDAPTVIEEEEGE